MKLVKYMGLIYGMKSVIEGLFKLSKASEFNDPFDCDGHTKDTAPPIILEPNRLKELRESKNPRYVDEHVCWVSRFMSRLDSKQIIDDYYRITCFREYVEQDRDVDRLFWSHYADHGAGIRVIFDVDTGDWPDKLERVSYDENVPTCDLSKASREVMDPEVVKFMHNRIFTKGTQWRDEAEVRLCVGLSDYANLVETEGLMFLPVSYHQIVGVDFGVKVSKLVARQWMDLCRNNSSLSHIIFRHAEKSDKAYSYRYIELD